jgi:hypothetical protein
MTPRDALSQLQALMDRHKLLPHEPLPQFVPDDQLLTFAAYARLVEWVDDLVRARFESHCFLFDVENLSEDVMAGPAAFRGVLTDGVPLLFPSTDQTCHGTYPPEALVLDLQAVFASIEEAVEATLPAFWQRHWWRR